MISSMKIFVNIIHKGVSLWGLWDFMYGKDPAIALDSKVSCIFKFIAENAECSY